MLTPLLPASRPSIATCAMLGLRVIRRKSNVMCHTRLQSTKAATKRKTSSAHRLRTAHSVLYHHFKDMGSQKVAQRFVQDFPEVESVVRRQLDAVASALQRKGYSWSEVNECKEVLLLNPAQLHGRLTLLNDLSLPNPSLAQVTYINKLMECTIEFLRENGLYRRNTDVFGRFIHRAKVDLSLPGEVIEEFFYIYRDCKDSTLKEMYIFLLKHYLAVRFSKVESEVEAFLNLKCGLLWQSLGGYVRICNLLIYSLGLNFEEVQASPVLLTVDTENVQQLLRTLPSIGLLSTKEIIKKFPNLSLLPHTDVERWVGLLHKHKVTDFTFTMDTLQLFASASHRAVGERLTVLTKLTEWEVIHSSSKLFSILLSGFFMKQVVNMASSEEGITRLHIDTYSETKNGMMTKRKDAFSLKQDLVTYLARQLSVSKSYMEELVSEELQQEKFWSPTNTVKVLQLLLDFGFTREQILQGIMVFGFESWMVEQSLKHFSTHPSTQPFGEWMESPFVLHLLVYCICKDNPHLEGSFKRR